MDRHFCPGRPTIFISFQRVAWQSLARRLRASLMRCLSKQQHAIADQVPSDLLKQGLIYPLQSNILETEIQTAARVAKLVFGSGLARVPRPADMVSFIREHVYEPEYVNEAAGFTARA